MITMQMIEYATFSDVIVLLTVEYWKKIEIYIFPTVIVCFTLSNLNYIEIFLFNENLSKRNESVNTEELSNIYSHALTT